MPNWASCTLEVDNDDFASKVAGLPRDEDGRIEGLFDAFVPMPPVLRTVTTGGTTINGVNVNLWFQTADGPVAVTPEVRAQWRQNYGSDNWYDWSIKHWGTKWDASSAVANGGEVHFDAPWGPPLEFVEQLSDLYPETVIVIAWAEGGNGEFGVAEYLNGVQINQDVDNDNFWKDNIDWDSIGDSTEAVTDKCYKHLDKYSLHTGG